jgi:2-oxoglutarate ferredoxin oxidoreductase subunit alpha
MSARQFDFALAIGGAAGQGIATPGDILARLFVRRGLHLNTYNAYQSIVRGGHIFLTVRIGDQPVLNHGDQWNLLLCLDQPTMDRHLRHMQPGTKVIFNADAITPGNAADGVELCPMPVAELTDNSRNTVMQNTVALGVVVALMRMDFEVLATAMQLQFGRKGQAVVDENVTVAQAGFDYALQHFTPFPFDVPTGPTPLAVWSGNEAIAMGGAAAGVNFYSAYPMSPASAILHWMANNAQQLGIMVRQLEDEIAVANVTIGAAHAGCRAMCATSGGGFALMTEAIGMAGMLEVPVVFINVQRAGPSTGVPTKTEQGDLWQVLGASQGDFERLIVAPMHALDAFKTLPELFNLVDRCQCPGIVISDLLISEGRASVDPADINMHPVIDRGALITEPASSDGYLRYRITESGVSPRALPGLEGYVHVVASDEQDEDGVLISDEFTHPHKRRRMVEKRARKLQDVIARIVPPALEGPPEAEVTLVGWGSTYGVIQEAVERLNARGVAVNHLPIKWIVPFHADAVLDILSEAKRIIVVENNYSGQFARYMRSETGIAAHGHIRKYDGEPFMPHHIVDGVMDLMGEKTDRYVPYQEVVV